MFNIDIGLVMLKILSVLGGAVLGAIFIRLLVGLLVRAFTRKQIPRPIKSVLSTLGGIAGALAVFLWVFGPGGGGGFGWGGGWGLFGQSGTGAGQHTGPATTGGSGPPDTRGTPGAGTVQVHMLGGNRVVDDRFYVLAGEPPRTLPELQQVLIERRQLRPELQELEIVIHQDSVADRTPAVEQLKSWAKANGWILKLSFPPTKAP